MNYLIKLLLVAGIFLTCMGITPQVHAMERFFQIQSIDTMKESRDRAREKENDVSYQTEIDKQVAAIAQTGATHVAISTPYDEEFVPYLKRWVKSARKHGLHIWLRGNLSGWEKWFDYEPITREEHTKAILEFLTKNDEILEDGDIFTSCPECENGGPGDPRRTGDVEHFRAFLINEYTEVAELLDSQGKEVTANLYSMNADVARLVMDRETTAALDGIVTIDHYIEDPIELIEDASRFADETGGRVVLGEFGAPIDDIHGSMSEAQQAKWITTLLTAAAKDARIIGVNYWVNMGGSTQIWRNPETPREGVTAITRIYTPRIISGLIADDAGIKLRNTRITGAHRQIIAEESEYSFAVLDDTELTFQKEGYTTVRVQIPPDGTHTIYQQIELTPANPSWLNTTMKKLRILINNFVNGILNR